MVVRARWPIGTTQTGHIGYDLLVANHFLCLTPVASIPSRGSLYLRTLRVVAGCLMALLAVVVYSI